MKWIDALKIWNKAHGGSWCVPRKGTSEHAEVKAIMSGEMIKGAQKQEFSRKRRGAVANLRETVEAARAVVPAPKPLPPPPRRPSVSASKEKTMRRDSNMVSFISKQKVVSFPVRNPILGLRLPPIRQNLPGMVDDF
jgi:hypothetical protein